jgi:hypothetical protein
VIVHDECCVKSTRAFPAPYCLVLSRLHRLLSPGGWWWPNRNVSCFRGMVAWSSLSSFERFGTAFCTAPRRTCPQPRRFAVVEMLELPALSASQNWGVSGSGNPWPSHRKLFSSSVYRYSLTTRTPSVSATYGKSPPAQAYGVKVHFASARSSTVWGSTSSPFSVAPS